MVTSLCRRYTTIMLHHATSARHARESCSTISWLAKLKPAKRFSVTKALGRSRHSLRADCQKDPAAAAEQSINNLSVFSTIQRCQVLHRSVIKRASAPPVRILAISERTDAQKKPECRAREVGEGAEQPRHD